MFYGFLNEVIGIVMILPVMELQNRNAERSQFTELIITVYNLLGMYMMLPTLICMTKMAFTLKGIITFIRLVTLERITTRLTRNLQTHVI